ncbi:hypothetical protein HYPSUDRAFT_207540 [Hypholoma sublateritium FD-334 SS-4]|uniref:Uncharacterized protein n=1 Tax=Hypholoma sublateritium (strain FD-334 SS-4) TaxID=945553 RepID=A0A0D2N9S1_HYPSF|nr:hypothetical protein HYPSUDRAFT_207540 [Hypholoma sublateritium FD-334 SS-4]
MSLSVSKFRHALYIIPAHVYPAAVSAQITNHSMNQSHALTSVTMQSPAAAASYSSAISSPSAVPPPPLPAAAADTRPTRGSMCRRR